MTAHPLLSSERQDWRTPEWFLDLVRAVNKIGLDPATSPDNPARAWGFFARPDMNPIGEGGRTLAAGWGGRCGLSADWSKHCPPQWQTFANPPYGAHLSGPIDPAYEIKRKGEIVGIGRGWAEKIAQHAGEKTTLVPVRSETEWWTRLFYTSDLALLWKSPEHGSRISFVHPETGEPADGSNLASTVFYTGPNVEKFAAVFSPHGTLIRGGKRT